MKQKSALLLRQVSYSAFSVTPEATFVRNHVSTKTIAKECPSYLWRLKTHPWLILGCPSMRSGNKFNKAEPKQCETQCESDNQGSNWWRHVAGRGRSRRSLTSFTVCIEVFVTAFTTECHNVDQVMAPSLKPTSRGS